MATDQKLSTLVESQLPSFLLEEGPKFVSFIKAYYEWLETNGQATDALKNLIVNQDLDTTNLNQFYEYFRREVLSEFPENVLADKRLLAKRIKDLYRAKGTQQAHRLLFRLLYNEEIEFYDPSRNILKTSDGRWVKQNSIRLGFPLTGQTENLVDQIVVGQQSGASAKVESVVTTRESGVEVKELFLGEISGTFIDLETVSNQANTISGVIVNAVGPLKNITIPDFRFSRGGSGHVRGDRVSFTSASGTGATGFVTSTNDRGTTFIIQDGGSGYRVANTVVTLFGGQGFDGQVTVTSISDPEIVFRYTDTIGGLSDTPIGFGPTYSSNSGIVSANLASANAFTTLSVALGTVSTTVGTINSISVIAGNYETLPGVSAVDLEIALLELPDGSGGIKGKNAVIVPQPIPGAITAVSVLVPGSRYNAADPVTIANLSRTGTVPGLGNPVISGVVENPGKYIDTKGFLSWDQFLQDGNYYQIFSYVIKSDQAIKTYRNLVNKLVHPAGTKFFGQVDIEDTIDLSGDIDTEAFILTNLIGGANGIPSILSTITFGLITQLSRTLPVESLTTTVDFGLTTVLRAISPASIFSTTVISGNTELIFNIDPAPVVSALTFGDLNWNFAFTLNSIDPTVTFGIPLLVKSVTLQSIEPVTVISSNTVLVMFVDPISLTSTISFNGNQLNFEYDVPSLDITTVFSPNTLLLVLGTGTVSVSNNNTVTTYLDEPISTYLNNEIVIFGTPFTVMGNNTIFTVEIGPGAAIEIQDLDPGLTGNTTYIVNTVFSNTSLSINTPFAGGTLANGIFRYTQS